MTWNELGNVLLLLCIFGGAYLLREKDWKRPPTEHEELMERSREAVRKGEEQLLGMGWERE